MSYDNALPFDVINGDTAGGGGLVTLAAGDFPELAGLVRTIPDTVYDTVVPKKVRFVRLAAAITGASKALAFDTGEEDYGAEVSGFAASAGAVTKPLYTAYDGETLLAYDVVAVVEEGYTTVVLGATVTAQAALTTNASAKYVTATAGDAITAIAMEAGDADDEIKVYVLPGLAPSDPAS